MKVAYICHHGRPNYEETWFTSMPVEKVIFITSDTTKQSSDPKVEFRHVKHELKGWENKLIAAPKDASTTTRVFYSDYESVIADADIVVVLEVFSSLSRQFVEYCKKIGKPVVALVYELIETHPLYKIPRYRGNTQRVLKKADHFIAVSDHAAQHLVRLGAPAKKITTVYPGINLDIFKADRSKRDDKAIMFVGKLEPRKGIDMVIESYIRLQAEIPNLTLTIAGSGQWEPEVEKLAQNYKSVTYLRHVPNAKLPETLNRHGIYIMPARDTIKYGQRIGAEQFGFSIVEAMACGLAAVTTDCGALGEIVTDKNIICRQGDTEQLYHELKSLLNDQHRITKLGKYNEDLAKKRYDVQKEAALLAQVLEEVAARHD